jgi:hypothetical protein
LAYHYSEVIAVELKDFASLPEQLQVILVSGYLGYSIAHAGFRDNERKDDVLYGILSFGIFGYIFYDFTRKAYATFLLPGLGALLVSVFVALFWRKYGRRTFNAVLHKSAISNEDGIKTTWARLIQDTTIAPSQLVVLLKDGSVIECDDVQSFGNAPVPLYYTDAEGSIAFYVTRKISATGEVKELQHTRNTEWGDKITYVSKDQISSISIRFLKKR